MCEGFHRPPSPIRFPSLLALLITVSHPLTVNDSNVYFSVTRTEYQSPLPEISNAAQPREKPGKAR